MILKKKKTVTAFVVCVFLCFVISVDKTWHFDQFIGKILVSLTADLMLPHDQIFLKIPKMEM